MLETLPAETATTTTTCTANKPLSSSLFAFVPRQVALAKHQNMRNITNSETLENDSVPKTPAIESKRKNKKDKSKKMNIKGDADPSPLLVSIAAYLQHQGFTKTLAAFQSEASITELDGSKIHELDLETYYKYLETGKLDSKSNTNGSEEVGTWNDGEIKEDQRESENATLVELSTKKKKRSIEGEVSTIETPPIGTVPESQLDGSKKKSKDKKKKKSKLVSVEKGDGEICSFKETPAAEKSSSKILLDEQNLKPKDKKAKKLSPECLLGLDTKECDQVDADKNDCKKENVLTLEDNITTDNRSSKKRKRIVSEGNESQPDADGKQMLEVSHEGDAKEPGLFDFAKNGSKKENNLEMEDNVVITDKKKCKKRRRMISEGNDSLPGGDVNQTSAVSEANGKEKGLLESDGKAGKKSKTVNGQADPKTFPEISLDKTPKGKDNETKADLQANGDLERSGREGTAPQKGTKKQKDGLSEPTSVKAFQRVKIDEVKFADDRLQDNSYWAKGGAEIGYGAKAQAVLGQVRGRDFRHEKTKKKRGSYRGGQIDLQTHSIKFNYSEED